MNAAQLHLTLTHFPIVGFIASFALLLYAFWRGGRELRNVALVGIAVSGLIILPVLASGNAAEHLVERLPGVTESLLEQHESAADTAGALAMLAGAAALVTLMVLRWAPRFATASLLAVSLLVVVATAGVGWTAHLGGQIRHPEIALAWNDPAGAGDRAASESTGDGRGLRGLLPALGGQGDAHDDDHDDKHGKDKD